MRTFVLCFALLFFGPMAFAQPSNDDCDDAIELSLTNAPACPSTGTVTDNFSYSNVDATPISPYPLFNCADGTNNGPANEVWFYFEATANQTEINISGLADNNMVLYRGTNCISLQAINCSSGGGTATTTTNTLVGETYYLMVSGGDPTDMGFFDIEIVSGNLCSSCAPPGAVSIDLNPPPINGSYVSGSSVEVCVTINEWDANAAGTIEWLHSVTFDLGPGWESVSAADATPPASIYGNGNWAWHNSWTSCATSNSFGPGFAFESFQTGGNCGSGVVDGDPGNNWGDGDTFAGGDITSANAITFCVNLTVSDCPPNITGEDLSIDVEVWSDGDSGSWTQTGCNTGQSIDLTSSAICCNDDDPLVTVNDASCNGLSDGSFEIEGNGGNDPSEVFNIYVLDAGSNTVFECLGCQGTVITPSDLPAGNYTIVALNVATDCPVSVTETIGEPSAPTASAMLLNMPCPGVDAILEGSVNPGGSVVTYQWTDPDGVTTYNGQQVSVPNEGTYTLVATVDGCESTPATVDVMFTNFTSTIQFTDDEVCQNGSLTFTASDGTSFAWLNVTTNEDLGGGSSISPTFSQTGNNIIRLTAMDAQGCTAIDEITVTVNSLPNITASHSGDGCENVNNSISATGAGAGGSYVWADDPFAPNPRDLTGLAPGFYDFTVTGTDANGCSNTAMVSVEVLQAPTGTLDAVPDNVCSGEAVTITANVSNISSIFWYDGVGPANQNPITINPTSSQTITADVTNTFGCVATFVTSVTVEQPPAPAVVSCGQTTSTSVEFVWTTVPGADDYEITIDGGSPETVGSTSYTVTGLMPNQTVTIVVQPLGAAICPVMPTTFMCTTDDCPMVDLDIDLVADICLDGTETPFNLTFTTSDNTGTPTWSGTAITNASNGTFDPSMADPGINTINLDYQIGDCTYTATIDINVNTTPSADFSLSSTAICSNETVDVNYQGTAGAGATYNWDFDGGTANPGNGQGPHLVFWDGPGLYTISLEVIENGCASEVFTQDIEVSDPLSMPTFQCEDLSSSTLTISWSTVIGATDYQVDVTSGQTGIINGNSIEFTGLSPLEDVTIELTVVTDNPCGNLILTHTCTTLDCPTFNIDIDPIADICIGSGTTPITLTASVSGGDGSGTLSWSGTGVTGDQFDPATAGNYTITATYTEGNCSSTTDIMVDVFDPPTATFTIDPDPICTGQETIVTYTGSASAGATYNWDFDGGTATPGTGPGPHQVSWPTAGTRTVTLNVTENNCDSGDNSESVTVQAPLSPPAINCNPTTNSIVFSWNAVTGAVDYQVTLVNAPAGASGSLDVPNRTYTVTGLAANDLVEIQVIAIGNGPCGNSMASQTCFAEDCPMVNIVIDPVDPICLDSSAGEIDLEATITGGDGSGTLTWSGLGITDMDQGLFHPQVADVGIWTITATYQQGNCPYNTTIDIEVLEQPSSAFLVDDVICVDQSATVTYDGDAPADATYNWDFDGGIANPGTGQGSHTVSWPTGGTYTIGLTVIEEGCAGEPATMDVTVDEYPGTPVVSCMSTTSSVTFSWDAVAGATGYQVNEINIPAGASSTFDNINLTYTVTGLNEGESVDIEVVALSDGACGNVTTPASCTAEACPMVSIEIDPVDPICLTAAISTIDLEATITGGAGGGTSSWSGDHIIDVNEGLFDAQMAGPGTWTVTLTYVEGNCSYSETIDIAINAQPSAAFAADAVICITDEATITYTGGADPGATYDWNFGTGTATPGTGQGPHTVSWPTGGMHTISLTVTENNCASEEVTQMVTVDELLTAPVINCMSTTSSITFSWVAVPGATGYLVNEISIPPAASGTYDDAALTYTVTGLNAGESVEIEVVAEGDGACGNSSATETCIAEDCPMVSLEIDPVDPICLDGSVSTLDLSVTITGGNGGGTGTWSGTGITDMMEGIFDPAIPGAGTTTITFDYAEGNCMYSESIMIEINAQPSADFLIDDDQICVNESITVTYDGDAALNADYQWDFDGGNATPGTGQGPHTVDWSAGGMPEISLIVTENDCASEVFMQTLTVFDSLAVPMITCEATLNGITFSWQAIAGSTGYTVDILSGPTGDGGTLDEANQTFTINDLEPGDELTIQVNTLTDSPCGGTSAQATCSAESCPIFSFGSEGFGPFCADAGSQMLSATINGGDGSGTFSWSGPGIQGPDGQFDPADAGTGLHDLAVSYTEGNCSHDTTYQIEVMAVPEASFTVDSPICVSDATTITFDGTAGSAATYIWDFDSGTILSGLDEGPYSIEWDEAGVYTISLSIEENGCTSELFVREVTVDPEIEPVVINCATTSSTSVTFAWDEVAGADTYTVEVLMGPNGVQDGNTYTMTGLTPEQEVSIRVTASGPGSCEASTAEGSCFAQACQPLTLSVSGPTTLCSGETAELTFDFTTTQAGPFVVSYSLNGGDPQEATLTDGQILSLPALTESTDFAVLSVTDANLPECTYDSDASWSIAIDQPQSAGTALPQVDICEGDGNTIDLNSLLESADPGGSWSTGLGYPGSPGSLDAASGTFAPAGQPAGLYNFLYSFEGSACPDTETAVSVGIVAAPVADAGLDQTLNCNMGSVTLGGNGTTTNDVEINWSSDNPEAMISDPAQALIDVSVPGTYTLTVTNQTGCSAEDISVVNADFDVPVADINISEISCFEANDGAIVIDNVSGGAPPYSFVFNGGAPTSTPFFGNLGPAEYSVIIQDANSCFTELFVNLEQPEEVVVEIVTNLANNGNLIQLGESITLEAQFNPNINIDTIIWQPDSIAMENARSVTLSPLETSTYMVTIADENGCSDSDQMTVIVEKLRPVYFPTAFSPDNDGTNDIFYVQTGNQDIREIKSFHIFNRWGEAVFENSNFQPNDPAQGWDGTHRGQLLNAAVFVYFAEVEFTDGEVILFKGDVILLR